MSILASYKKVSSAVQAVIGSMPIKARSTAFYFSDKNIFEIQCILNSISLSDSSSLSFLDVGSGTGVTISALKILLPNASCHAIDRFTEFSDCFNREAGTEADIVSRLNSLGVVVHSDSFKSIQSIDNIKFNCISAFDVIEHLDQPLDLLNFIETNLASNGSVFIGTPNQVHLFNRIKCLVGLNTWEDYSYWMSNIPFFGHIRELTPSELLNLPFASLACNSIRYSNWPLSRYPLPFAKLLNIPLTFPGLGLYMCSHYQAHSNL